MIESIKKQGCSSLDSSQSSDTEAEETQTQATESTTQPDSIFSFNPADLPENQRHLGLLVESCRQLEELRSQIRPAEEMESEFLSVLKSTKHGVDKVFTCSATLKLLIEKHRQSTETIDSQAEQIESLEQQNHDLAQNLTDERSTNKYLRKQNTVLQQRLTGLVQEKKRLNTRVEYLQTAALEQSKMQEQDYFKLLWDN